MKGRSRHSSISATELIAELQNDPEYQRECRAAEAERQERAQVLTVAEQPIVADLCSAQLGDLVDFLSVAESGQTRIYFVEPILKWGGERGREIVEALRTDAVLARKQLLC